LIGITIGVKSIKRSVSLRFCTAKSLFDTSLSNFTGRASVLAGCVVASESRSLVRSKTTESWLNR
jgi:hypothetical protein